MSESLGDNPDPRLSHAGIAAGGFARHPQTVVATKASDSIWPRCCCTPFSAWSPGPAHTGKCKFIRIHLQRLNEAFALRLRCSPSYTGLRLIIQGVDPAALEAAFRQHALSISTPLPWDGLTAIADDGKTLRGSFDAFSDRKATHMMSALRQADPIVLGHGMVDEKSNETPAALGLIEACVFTLERRARPKNVRAHDRLGQSSAHPCQGQPTEPAP
jgi:hypothetical protein